MTQPQAPQPLHTPHPAHLCQNVNYVCDQSCNGFCHNRGSVVLPSGLRICSMHARMVGVLVPSHA